MKIYAEDFKKIGFYISHKNEALQELAEYNKANFNRQQSLCDGKVRRKVKKTSHSNENHEKLPTEISGHHFDNFKEICGCLGCYLHKDKL